MPGNRRTTTAAIHFTAVTFAITACAPHQLERTHTDTPIVYTSAAADDLEFWSRLRDEPIATNADTIHALVLFAGLELPQPLGPNDTAIRGGTAQRAAINAGWLRDDHPLDMFQSARVGLAAWAVARTSAIDLGIVGLIANDDPYTPGSFAEITATKRLRQLGMLPDRSANQPLTGAELVALLRRAEIYEQTGQQTRPVDPLE